MSRSTYVPPTGKKDAPYIIVGEQPNRFDILNGRPFSGYDGTELFDDLHLAGINKADCYLTNVIKDADALLSSYIEFHPRRGTVIHPKGQEYIDELARELNSCTGKVIIALGNVALFALADRVGVTKWRGSVITPTLVSGKLLVPSNHPSTIWLQYTNKRLLIYDLKRAKDVIEGRWNPLERSITIRPTYLQSLQFLKTCELWGKLGNPVAYDIEVDVFNGEMTCISFAYTPTDIMSIPFVCEHGDYFTPPQEADILIRIGRLLEDPDIPILGQNLVFDCTYMLRKYGIKTTNIHDTMVAQKTLLTDYPVALHFICSMYTDIAYYKDDGKYWLKGIGSWESGWRYNALDSAVCIDAYPKQVNSLIKQHNYPAYERKRQSILPYVYIMEHGIRINLGSMQQAYDEMGCEQEAVLKQLQTLAGFPLNPNSPKQVKEYFYVTKRLPAYKGKDGSVTTDEKALKRIARKGYREASLILKLRGLGKERSTFLEPGKVDQDGRMRCSYNPVGTRFSRASSSENIFGTGNNLQNQPHRVLSHFLADPGYVFYGMDLGQAENRLVAYIGRITQMIECFETGKDVHSMVAVMMANLFFNGKLPADFNPKETLAPIGNGEKPWRDWGKKCVVGSTEILTPRGWIKIEDWNYKKTQIAQWSPIGSKISFVDALDCTSYMTPVIELGGRNSHVIGSPNHRIPLRRTDKNKFKVVELDKIDRDPHYGIPTCGNFYNEESMLTPDEVKLLVAYQADGTLHANKHCFKFKKLRKILRIKEILGTLNIPYNETLQGGGEYFYISFKGPFWLTKDFSSNLLCLGLKEMQTFVNELHHWDGYKNDKCKEYYTTDKNNVEWAQTIAHLCGYTATISTDPRSGIDKKLCYILKFNNRNINATLVSQGKRYIEEPQMVYGPTVPSGFVIIRSNGKISITGNTGHAANYDISYQTLSLYNEIPERDGKMILNIYHTGFPGVRKGFHEYVKKCISKDRTLTNYMGRKTVFTDKVDDNLFRAAYACIPQGTVGDIIDQRGLNFIYYNSDPIFRYVELLIQVHDQIGFQIPTPFHPTSPVDWTVHSRILNSIKGSLERPLYTHYGHRFVIPVDTTMGVTLNKDDGQELEKKVDGKKVSCLEPEFLEESYFKCTERWMPTIINAA